MNNNYDNLRLTAVQPIEAHASAYISPSELDLARAAAIEAAESVSASNVELFRINGKEVRLMGVRAAEMTTMEGEMKKPANEIDKLPDPYSPEYLAAISADIVSWRQSELAA